jgi:hypothetical protein
MQTKEDDSNGEKGDDEAKQSLLPIENKEKRSMDFWVSRTMLLKSSRVHGTLFSNLGAVILAAFFFVLVCLAIIVLLEWEASFYLSLI